MKIKIRFFAELREIVGEREKILAFPDSHVNIAKLLNFLVDVYGEKFKEKIFDKNGQLFNHYIILVNGKNIKFLEGLETTLKDEDEVSIFPPVGGG